METYFEKNARDNELASLMMLANGAIPDGSITKWTYAYVKNADIGDDYVSGSEGQIKTMKGYKKDDTFIVRYVFKYEDADLPTNVTESEIFETEV